MKTDPWPPHSCSAGGLPPESITPCICHAFASSTETLNLPLESVLRRAGHESRSAFDEELSIFYLLTECTAQFFRLHRANGQLTLSFVEENEADPLGLENLRMHRANEPLMLEFSKVMLERVFQDV